MIRDYQRLPRREFFDCFLMVSHRDIEDTAYLMQLPTSELFAASGRAYSTDCYREYQRRERLDDQ